MGGFWKNLEHRLHGLDLVGAKESLLVIVLKFLFVYLLWIKMVHGFSRILTDWI